MTVRTFEPLSRPRTILLSGLFTAAIVAGAFMIRTAPAGVYVQAGPVDGVALYDTVRTQIARLYIDTLSEAQLYRLSIDGMVSELGDPYSVFLPPDRLGRLNERTSGNYAGIGLQVDMRDGYVFVVSPLAGGPGEQAGMLTGDRIAEIDGKAVNGWTVDEVQRLLRGAPGSPVSVTVDRAGTSIQFALTRKAIHQSAIRHTMILPGNIGYVELRVFSDSTEHELRKAVDSLVRAGVRSLVLDVRANPGGFLEQGVRVTDLFLDKGKRIVSTRGRIETANKTYDDTLPQRWPSLTIGVLVDDKTASAAELLAGALQDHDRAVVVGLTTYGKGSAQNVYPLDSAGALKITTSRWYTPVGRSISRVALPDGVSPNDSAARHPAYKTDAGRTVLGGGGITPDVIAGDTALSLENIAFMRAVGKKVGAFRDALTSFALQAKASHSIASPAFVVTPAMLDDVYQRMEARGVSVPRSTYDDSSPLVARLLSYEIARYVFGTNAEFQRKALDDKALNTVERLLNGARTQTEVLNRARSVKSQSASIEGVSAPVVKTRMRKPSV